MKEQPTYFLAAYLDAEGWVLSIDSKHGEIQHLNWSDYFKPDQVVTTSEMESAGFRVTML
ncbi:MAG: hypothetical protein CMF59_16715 [Leptospiraceae bacterium]|nr:hypothetical protein [Leptospiraceae bacterium]